MPFYSKGLKIFNGKLLKNNNKINKQIIPNHINTSTTNKLVGKNPSTDRYIYSYQNPYLNNNNGSFIRNPNCWLNGVSNISCFSPAQLSGANWWQRGGTLITKKHFVLAKHFAFSIIQGGTPILFVDENNNSIKRNLIQYAVDDTDIAVGLLDSEVPSNIKIAKVLPQNFVDYFTINITNSIYNTSTTYGFNILPSVYSIGLDQEEKALVKLFAGCALASVSVSSNTLRYQITLATDVNSWGESLVAGDSGDPLFILIDNELVLLSCWFTVSGGPFITNRYDQVNALINSLSPNEGYSLTPVDLASVYAKYS